MNRTRISFLVFLGTGLFLLSVAFLFSLFSHAGETYKVVVVLEANPGSYVNFVWTVVLYGILPLVASLVFLIVAHIKEKETLSEGFGNWLFLLVGIFCVLLGFLGVFGSCDAYVKAINYAHRWFISGIDGSLLAIYLTYGFYSVLWMITGLFLVVAYASRARELRGGS